jgi:hypothetical protein
MSGYLGMMNSRQRPFHAENEEYLRRAMIENCKLCHLHLLITPDIALADLRDPKFRSMATADHTSTSKWFNKQYFETNNFELCHNFQSTALGPSGSFLDQPAYSLVPVEESGPVSILGSITISSGTHGGYQEVH